ncbi:MAG: EthD family reductase [Kineosporiaceae bacterium]
MIKVVAFVRRRRDISREEFVRRWTVEHVALSSRLGMHPYRINVAVEPQDDGSAPPYDGTAEMYWPDLATFRAALASHEGVLAGDDVARSPSPSSWPSSRSMSSPSRLTPDPASIRAK